MTRYLEIGKENLKHNVWQHSLVCIVLLLLSPLVLGIENLTAVDTAKVLEMYIALIGIILLTPIFLPEQNKDLRDLVYSKYVKASAVYFVRVVEAALILIVLVGVYMGVLYYNNCDMEAWKYFFGTLAGMMFFGGMGLFFYGLLDNLVVGYMVPIFYYIVAMGSGAKYLKVFYPFAMTAGSYKEKCYMAVAAVVLIIAGLALRCKRGRG